MTKNETPWFTSDLHFEHRRICEYSNRPWLQEKNTEELIKRWNDRVGLVDDVFHLGDFAFIYPKKLDQLIEIIKELNGNIHFIRGNHCDKKTWQLLEDSGVIHAAWVKDYHEMVVQGQDIVLSHYPMEVWRNSHHGSWMLHGHCVDDQTEILTTDGWKFRDGLMVGDTLPTYSFAEHRVVEDTILQLFDQDYTGVVYTVDAKRLNFRVTAGHRLVGYNRSGLPREVLAKDYEGQQRFKFVLAGRQEFNGLPLTDDQIRLYTYLAADGTLKFETSLWRLRVKKPHKIAEIGRVLQALGIEYNQHVAGGMTSFNFYTPSWLLDFKVKGLDTRLREMTCEQFSVLMDAYGLSDGSHNGNGIILTTAKKVEADLIAELAVVRGWGCTTLERVGHGFGAISWQLSLYPSTYHATQQDATTEFVENEHFWCGKTNSGNFFIRRDGKIHLTGNCHGSLPPRGKRLDCGIDNHPEHQIWSYEEIATHMAKQTVVVVDHHNGDRA